MGSSSKRRMTAEKRAREQRLRERRAAKEERKAARKAGTLEPSDDGSTDEPSGDASDRSTVQ